MMGAVPAFQPLTRENELSSLEEQATYYEEALGELKARISELKSETSK
jgi:hypothetical protein